MIVSCKSLKLNIHKAGTENPCYQNLDVTYIVLPWWHRHINNYYNKQECCNLNTLRPGQDGHHFGRWHFQVHFLERKVLNFKSNFTAICYLGSNWPYGSIDSNNGLAPNRWQAIIWSNVDMLYLCIYASLSLNELNTKQISTNYLSVIWHNCAEQ